ncbi:hypothetical protein HK405_005798, partial [Cladochytrium tenue]
PLPVGVLQQDLNRTLQTYRFPDPATAENLDLDGSSDDQGDDDEVDSEGSDDSDDDPFRLITRPRSTANAPRPSVTKTPVTDGPHGSSDSPSILDMYTGDEDPGLGENTPRVEDASESCHLNVIGFCDKRRINCKR